MKMTSGIFGALLARCAGLVLGAFAWTSSLAAPAFDYDVFLKSVRVPPGFTIDLAAGEPMIRFPMFACYDDAGRLYVAESSGNDLYAGLKKLTRDCRVSRLEDADGDGRFDKATVFASGVTFPMGLAWHDGRLYLADPPELVALTDTDGDGRADKREVILSGFGHTDNGSLHGLTFGPDGLLYFTMGEPDGWKLPRGDGTFLEGVAGALFRCRPDGSQPEVVSRGFENLVEIEFMPGGEFIGTDNWFQKPAGGWRDALVDCAPGGLYPYAPARGTPLPRTGVTLPPLILLPAVAHSGLTRLRTTGFPEEWRGSLFVAEHNTRKVVRHELRREGSTFASTNVDFVAGEHPDFHPADVLESSDGSLLIVDTGGWYVEHCPTGRIRDSRAPGGIYRARWTKAREVKPASDEARFAALWKMNTDQLRARLADGDVNVICAAARVLASRREKSAGDALVALLDSTQAPVRRASAEALTLCGARSHAPRLVAALAKAGNDFEEHACIAALLSLADEPFVRGLLAHETPRVRRAALHLLDQPPFATLRFADLTGPLGDSDANVNRAARHLLEGHNEWAADALPWLRQQLATSASEAGSLNALSALFVAFQSDAGIRGLISELLAPGAPTPVGARAFLLNLLPSLTTKKPEAAWLQAIGPALADPALRIPALGAASAYPQPEFAPRLAKLAEDTGVPAPQRLLAARVSARHPTLSESVFELAVKSLDAKAGAAERLSAVDLLARTQLTAPQLQRLLTALLRSGAVAPDGLLPTLARSTHKDTRPALADFFNAQLKSGWSPARAILDQTLAMFPDEPSVSASLLAAWETNNAAMLQRLAEFKPLLAGGDAERGRVAFTTATCAGCHRIGERGGLVGPDLTRIGAIRSGGDLLESILYPSSSFAQGYVPYLLTRRDGEEISGSLVEQGPEGVSLRDGAGVIHRTRPDDIAALDRQQLSSMPAGLEQILSREHLRDLLAYLQSLK